MDKPWLSTASSLSSSTLVRSEFDVFLSFRGENTWKGFTESLYKALTDRGITTFIDGDHSEEMGERMSMLLRYMTVSKIFVPIFSTEYADSKWSFMEAAMMVEVVDNTYKNKWIVPIFVDIARSDVLYQKGSFGYAFLKHENNPESAMKITRWKAALKMVGGAPGYSFNSEKSNMEDTKKLINIICGDISRLLERVPFRIDSQVTHVLRMLAGDRDRVCMIGICGVGGIGKTTLATAVYEMLAHKFEGSDFISDVKETAKRHREISTNTIEERMHRTKQKFRNMKVLIILDCIDNEYQLNAFTGDRKNKQCDIWFGAGSKIIVTSRNEELLIKHGLKEYEIYHVKELNACESLELFSRHANAIERPEHAVDLIGGLPLALEVLGPLSRLETWNECEAELNKLRHKDIHEKLKLRYDRLHARAKSVLLDVACLLIGSGKDNVFYMWEDCPEGIEVLQDKSLIRVDSKNRLRMHDQIRDMGRTIVQNEGRSDPPMYSRLWDRKDILKVLEDPKEKKEIEGIVLDLEGCDAQLSSEALKTMPNLRLLHLSFCSFKDFSLSHFPETLKWLECRAPKLESLLLDGRFTKLVILNLSQSDISELKLADKFDSLKVLDLSQCLHLNKAPFFPCLPNLEKLFLDDTILTEIDESIGHLKKLILLSLGNCELLSVLPAAIGDMTSLKVVNLGRCSQLTTLPDTILKVSKLEELNLQGCKSLLSLPQLPSSLKILCLQGCKRTKVIHGFHNLEHLKRLQMDGCEDIDYKMMGELFKGLTSKHLEEMSISGYQTTPKGTRFDFMLPIGFTHKSLLLKHLLCHVRNRKHGIKKNIKIKVCVLDSKGQVRLETESKAHRDIDNNTGTRHGCCYSLHLKLFHVINARDLMEGTSSLRVSTIDETRLTRVDIVLRSINNWRGADSEKIIFHDDVSFPDHVNDDDRESQKLVSPNKTEAMTMITVMTMFLIIMILLSQNSVLNPNMRGDDGAFWKRGTQPNVSKPISSVPAMNSSITKG